jgi:hypothetical protein
MLTKIQIQALSHDEGTCQIGSHHQPLHSGGLGADHTVFLSQSEFAAR